MKHRLPFLLLFFATTLGISSCGKKEVKPDPAVVLAEFIPWGWSIEFDTLAPVLDGGKMGHVTVMRKYDSSSRVTMGRMICIIGSGAKGKLRRYGANSNLLPIPDISTGAYVHQISELLKINDNVISVFTDSTGATNASFHSQEELKFRFDPKTKRFALIGYDLTDNTDGVVTTDSRNYPTKNRVVMQLHSSDTVFQRQLKLRHSGPFIEDIEPWQLAMDPGQLLIPKGGIPETGVEAEIRQEVTPDEADQDDSTEPASQQL